MLPAEDSLDQLSPDLGLQSLRPAGGILYLNQLWRQSIATFVLCVLPSGFRTFVSDLVQCTDWPLRLG